MKVFLDGIKVDEKKISPTLHKRTGTFRPDIQHVLFFRCPCGQSLWNTKDDLTHWQHGHMDIPQYERRERRQRGYRILVVGGHAWQWKLGKRFLVAQCKETGERLLADKNARHFWTRPPEDSYRYGVCLSIECVAQWILKQSSTIARG